MRFGGWVRVCQKFSFFNFGMYEKTYSFAPSFAPMGNRRALKKKLVRLPK